jgi:fumarylpyruvate hydrolase
MVLLAFPAAPAVTIPIQGSKAHFPVRRVLCVGRNYAAHSREMGGDAREPPFFFAKPADAVTAGDGEIAYPLATSDLHHEIELVIALGGPGERLTPESALGAVFGYAVGVDLTRRDLQAAAKAKGQPWEAGKAFDQSAPIGAIRPWRGAPPSGRIRLTVGGQVRQDGRIADMIWSVPEIIAQASALWRLAPGDLIFTGTPEGVGPIIRGDVVDGDIEDIGSLRFTVT